MAMYGVDGRHLARCRPHADTADADGGLPLAHTFRPHTNPNLHVGSARDARARTHAGGTSCLWDLGRSAEKVPHTLAREAERVVC